MKVASTKIHEIKIQKHYYDKVVDGTKTFEIRFNDRSYKEGDLVVMTMIDEDEHVTSLKVSARVGFIATYAQREGFVVFSLLDVNIIPESPESEVEEEKK